MLFVICTLGPWDAGSASCASAEHHRRAGKHCNILHHDADTQTRFEVCPIRPPLGCYLSSVCNLPTHIYNQLNIPSRFTMCLGESGSRTDGADLGFSASPDCYQYTCEPAASLWQVHLEITDRFFSCIFSWLLFPLWFTLHGFSISWWGTEILLLSSVSSWTCEMWMALGADPIVAGQIMEMVMEKLAIMAPYVDKKESMIRGGTIKVATNPPLAVSHKHSEVIHPFQVQYLVLTVLPSI